MKPRIVILLTTYYLLLIILFSGCEAFRKKFVRKPKDEEEIKVVIRTQEYKSPYSTQQAYGRYFSFWRAWHEELLNLLNAERRNRKRSVYCSKKTVENLQQLRRFLLPEKQKQLDIYIKEQNEILRQLDRFKLRQAQKLRIKSQLDRQKRKIQKEFTLRNIREYLVEQ